MPALPSVESLYERAACGLLVADAQGLILKVNTTFCLWVGRTPEELVGRKKLQELFTVGGRIFHHTHWLPMLQLQGSLAEVKLELMHADGRTVPMLLNVVRRAHGGTVIDEVSAVVAEDRNLYERELLAARKRADELVQTERKAQEDLKLAEARLRQALHVGKLFLWEIDPVSGARRFGDDVALLLGFGSERALSEADYVNAIDAADRAAEAEALRRVLDGSEEIYDTSYRLNGIDGVQRTVKSAGQGFFDQAGKLVRFVGVLSDVTQLVRERASAEDRALFAEQMVGIVSHDLRNPLSAILMGVHLLGRGELPADKQRVLGHVASSAERAQRLIEELLDFTLARLGAGLTVVRKPIDIHKLVGNIVEELALSFPDRLITHQQSGAGVCHADADRLAQLLGNLVANAMTYGAPHAPVTVSSALSGNVVSISVHNQGAPIPPDKLHSLFEPMVRGVPGNSAARNVGLGLFIVREIARAHQGKVQVVSDSESGTTFTVQIPA
ncbi:PAS domain S-box protein [Variovorax paradoxus]|nr:PAS domain S-box protein [Variovorax paradoxus]